MGDTWDVIGKVATGVGLALVGGPIGILGGTVLGAFAAGEAVGTAETAPPRAYIRKNVSPKEFISTLGIPEPYVMTGREKSVLNLYEDLWREEEIILAKARVTREEFEALSMENRLRLVGEKAAMELAQAAQLARAQLHPSYFEELGEFEKRVGRKTDLPTYIVCRGHARAVKSTPEEVFRKYKGVESPPTVRAASEALAALGDEKAAAWVANAKASNED